MAKARSYNPRLNNNNTGHPVESDTTKEVKTVQPPQDEKVKPEVVENAKPVIEEVQEEVRQIIYINESFDDNLKEAYQDTTVEVSQVDKWLQDVIEKEEQLTTKPVVEEVKEKIFQIGELTPTQEIVSQTKKKVIPHYTFKRNDETLKVERVVEIQEEIIEINNDQLDENLNEIEKQIVKLESEISNLKQILAVETEEAKVIALQNRLKIFEQNLDSLK